MWRLIGIPATLILEYHSMMTNRGIWTRTTSSSLIEYIHYSTKDRQSLTMLLLQIT
jgi:hypothetical protein